MQRNKNWILSFDSDLKWLNIAFPFFCDHSPFLLSSPGWILSYIKAQFVPAFFKAMEDFDYEEKGPMSETNYCEDKQREVATHVLEQLDISKGGNGDGGAPPKVMRRQSSLLMSYQSNALKTMIFRENLADDELVAANRKHVKKQCGNLYDIHGSVVRKYAWYKQLLSMNTQLKLQLQLKYTI